MRLDAHAQAARHAIDAVAAAVKSSLFPAPEEAWLVAAQLRLHRNGSRYSMLMMPIAAFLTAFAFAPWVPVLTRDLWWISMAFVCLVINHLNRRIERMTGHDTATIGRKSRYTVALSILFLTGWCSMGALFWVPGQIVDHMLIVLILACSLAGTIVVCAPHPALAATAIVIHAGFLIGPAAVEGSELDAMLALLCAMYTFLLVGHTVSLSIAAKRLFTLEHERSGIVKDLRAAKRESDRDRASAIEAGRAKSQFLSHMNHELRTPMNAILGFSELIRTRALGDDVERYAEYGGIIHDSGNHLLSLIDGMLDLAKIDAGKLSLVESEIDLESMIEEAVDEKLERADQAKIALGSDIERGLPRVVADERALRQIVHNLLSNGLKFTLPLGSVSIFARCEAGGGIAFGVADTGVGIADSDLPHVFERFGHARANVTTKPEGAGLGLAIVKGFAEAHDGSVEIESMVGAGTRVTVRLPKNRVGAGEPARLAG